MKSKYFNYWIIGLLLLFVPQQTIKANGDPVIRFSSINRVGNPTPRPIKDIQIQKEHLLIQPRGEYTYVEVEYTLYNHSKKNYKRIDYGFPIDYQGESESSSFIPDGITESIYEIGWKKEWIKDVQFSLDGKPLKWHAAHEVVIPKHREYVVEYEDTATIESASRLWHYTQFSIRKQDTVSLKVSYQVYQEQYTPLYDFPSSPLSRHLTGSGFFFYDFSPAQHWGDGTAHQIEVIVDYSVIDKDIRWNWKNNKPVYPFKQEGNRWIYQAENFSFKDAEKLSFYCYWKKKLENPYSFFQSFEVDKSLYQIEVSSSEKSYSAHHLSDKDIKTVWAPQGNDKEKTITITFHEPQVLSDIMLYNGNHQSASNWEKDARINELDLQVIWADSIYEVHRYKLQEFSHDYGYYYSDKERYEHPLFINLYSISTQAYGRHIVSSGYDHYHYLYVPMNENRIKQIKLTIREPLPAETSEKICVSEIILLNGWE